MERREKGYRKGERKGKWKGEREGYILHFNVVIILIDGFSKVTILMWMEPNHTVSFQTLYNESLAYLSIIYFCRSMSNDLELPDSPRAVIRTYSNRKGMDDKSPSTPKRGEQHSNSLRVPIPCKVER